MGNFSSDHLTLSMFELIWFLDLWFLMVSNNDARRTLPFYIHETDRNLVIAQLFD